jgi:hypothetical protein
MLQSHYVVSTRSRDKSRSQGERATAEQGGHLTRYRQSRQQKVGGKGQTLHLFRFIIRNHSQGLCTSRQTLTSGQSIQSLEGSLYLVLPQ